MLISEIFHSVQGEGSLVGVPSVFIRTSGCNLRCRWCDTPYASWRPEHSDLSVEAILSTVASYGSRHVVVTGGEPMLARDMPALLQALRAAGQHITIETAGTIAPAGVPCDLASISPKLSNSTPTAADFPGSTDSTWIDRHERTRLQPDVLRAWCQSYDYQLKFVISTAADLEEARQVIASLDIPIQPERVLLMPEGTSVEAIRQRSPLLVEACLTHGYRYSPRLHIDLFGNKRGT